VYTWAEALAVLFWAALHDRPISWACRRGNWPMQAWRRRLPGQSTMSRRLRDPAVVPMLDAVLRWVQEGREEDAELLIADGKPLEVSEYTTDPDARVGRGAGCFAPGYKLHAIIDPKAQAMHGWEVLPMNASEPGTAAGLVGRACAGARGILLGDSIFDSNPLHGRVDARGWQLIAPRKQPGTGLGTRKHHPGRLLSLLLTEGPLGSWEEDWKPQRDAIERYFGAMASFGGGLSGLPSWVRRIHRVRVWVGAKLGINAARIALRRAHAA